MVAVVAKDGEDVHLVENIEPASCLAPAWFSAVK